MSDKLTDEPGKDDSNTIKSDTYISAATIRIAICDDNDDDLSITKQALELCCVKCSEYTFQFFSFNDPLTLLQYIKENGSFDIILLDIYMPHKNGTQVAKILRNKNDQCEIIFITSSSDHTLDAYKVNAIQYLVKPFCDEDLCNAVNRAFVQLQKTLSKTLLLKTTTGLYRLNAKEIICTKARAHYQQIFLSDNRVYEVRTTVGELFEMLCAADKFMRIGSAHIVSVEHIVAIDSKKVSLKTGIDVPLVRNTYKKVKAEYLSLLFEDM